MADHPLRIKHLLSYHLYTGPAEPVLRLARAQRQAGHEASVACDMLRDGDMRERAEAFSVPLDERFVLSVKAGGTGLNLTAASHVVHFDRWWNPAVEDQATDRAYRIGQHRNVLVHKLVCRGTVEERIDRLIEDKQALARGVLTVGPETLLTELSDADLMAMVALDLRRATAEG